MIYRNTARTDFFFINFEESMAVYPLNGCFEAQLLSQFCHFRLQIIAFLLKVSDFIYPFSQLLVQGSVDSLVSVIQRPCT